MRIFLLSLIAVGVIVVYVLFSRSTTKQPTTMMTTVGCNMTQFLEDSISLPHQINLLNGERLTLTKIDHINFERANAIVTFSAEFNKATMFLPLEISFYVNNKLKIAGIKIYLPEVLKNNENYITTRLENVLNLRDIDLPPNTVGLEKIQANKLMLRQSY